MDIDTRELCLELLDEDEACQLRKGHLVPCTTDPDGGWIQIPTEPYSEILPGLWQGGTYFRPDDGLAAFDSVLTLYRSAPAAPSSVYERKFLFNDVLEMPPTSELADAANWVYGQWKILGKKVLVRCQAGLNRSGLVTALVLYQAGYNVDDAIALLREKRSPYALCNRRFVQHLETLQVRT